MHCRVRSNRSTISRCVYLVRSLSSRGRDCDVETGGNREAANDKKTRHGNTIEEKPTETYKGQRRMSVRARLSRTEHENFLRFQVLSIRLDRKGTLSKNRKSCCQLESERRQPSSLATLLLFEDNGSWLWHVFEDHRRILSSSLEAQLESIGSRELSSTGWFTASLASLTRHGSIRSWSWEKDKFHRSAKMGQGWWMCIPRLSSLSRSTDLSSDKK